MTLVGVVGTGRMGSAMTKALREAGHEVTLFNRTPQRATALANLLGCEVCASPAEVAAKAAIVLTMLADDAAVLESWRGPRGLIAGARPGTVLVDLSTVTPNTIRDLEADTRAKGAGILDSPVSGSVTLAESGQLTLMVGGTAEDLDKARPALEPLAKTIVHVGPLGTGAAMKLAVNTVIFGLNGAVAEGLTLAEAAGVDRQMAYDVIAASAVGAPYVQYKRAAFLDPEGTPTAFSLDLAAKDLGLIENLAERVGLGMPQSTVNLEVIRRASADLGGESDFSRVADHLRRKTHAGVGGA
ncbi:MAG TPA: NAD(P)-dependent oxidoreductase [Candidatus Limnocylindrales bacterium]|nr:NAD(P)-dependent oxidoreductase [Candidatus Limnocylindrales bacterium]